MDYTKLSNLKVEKRGTITLITLNRPDSLNAIDPGLLVDLEDAFYALATDDEVNAIVLTGAGRAFSAGGDFRSMKAAFEAGAPLVDEKHAYRLLNNILNTDKPIIAAVNGHALGFGAQLALFSDIVFASEEALFGDAHVKVGLVAGDGGAVIWPLLIGHVRAKQYLMTGDTIPAREAERIGMVNKVLPTAEVLPAAMAFAERLANGPTKAIGWTKASVNQILKHTLNLVMPASAGLQYLSMKTADHIEAVDAFLEKRPPSFKGK